MRSRLTLWALLGLSCATPAAAQLASQTALVGTVTDSGGAVVPGAQVVAVNTGTKDTYETTTNAEGYYNIQFVRTGTYEITVSVTGFQTFKATGVQVTGNQVVRTDGVLKIGNLTESVNVEARAQVLTTDSATVSETIGKRAIVELPLNGRNVWSLAATTPGVLAGINSDIGLSFRGAGQREIQNSLSLDGINASANLLASTSMRPIADAVEEIQIQTGSTSAEYGSYLGVAINVVTKSGTNTMHGSAFNFFKDDALNSRGWYENPANPKNPLRSNQFGFETEGPVMIPGLYDGHNKTFFMGAYEGVRAESLSPTFGSVPTALMRQRQFLGDQHRHQKPVHWPAVSGQHHPAVDAIAGCAWTCCSTTRRRMRPARPIISQPRRRVRTTSTNSSGASIRTSATRSVCLCATTGTTASIRRSVRFPRPV